MRHSGGINRKIAVLWLATAMSAVAPAGAAQARVAQFHVAAGSLDSVLTNVAAQAGKRIIFDPAAVRGRSAAGVSGLMEPEAAIRRALNGTALSLRTTASGDWIISAPAADAGGQILSTVHVTASTDEEDRGSHYVGANGSSDPIATEGTRSYTTTGTIVASKHPLALKETPQAVSVVTRQQIDDRTINGVTDALAALPGVTDFNSRGFAINNVQIDGGSPIFVGAGPAGNFISQYTFNDDLSIYDSVAIQRGAAGTFTGVGSPGGAISLERKRPLDHAATEVTLQGGSWDRLRGVLDASSPILLGGLLRARTVVTGERNDYFYDHATRRFAQVYANIEIDPADGTTINVGAKVSHHRDTPFRGLPTGPDGHLLDLPRSTCLCTPWSRSTTDSREAFAQLTQRLGASWKAHLNSTAVWQDGSDDAFIFNPRFNAVGTTPGKLNDGRINAYLSYRKSNQYLLDGYLDGKFALLGIGFDVTVGGNYQRVTQTITHPSGTYAYRNFVVIPFDPQQFPQPTPAQYKRVASTYNPDDSQRQFGGYATITISPVNSIHLTIAERYSAYKSNVETVVATPAGKPPVVSANSTSFDNLSPPNFSLVVDLSRKVSAYTNYNSIFDRFSFYQADGTMVKPATGVNIEGGLKQVFAGGTLNASQAVFYIESRNTPVMDPKADFALSAVNGSQCCFLTDGSLTRSKGVEFQLQGALTPRFNIDASYTYTRTDNELGPVALAQQITFPISRFIPDHLAKFWATWRPQFAGDRLTLGFGGHIESKVAPYTAFVRYDPASNSMKLDSFDTPRPGYATIDAMLGYRLDRRFSLQANVTNLGDRVYYSTVQTSIGSFYGRPRSFLLTLKGKL